MADHEAEATGPSGGPSVWDTPIGLFAKSQEQAMKAATDTLQRVRSMTMSGVSSPDLLMQQVVELSGAVTGLAGTASGLTGALVQPMQDFLTQQRELADSVAKFAEVQADLAAIVAEFAQRQAATVAAIERLAGPVFDVMGTQRAKDE